ncbi:MAG: hypothetical protein AVDCRST_MAG41-1081 [uncultured Corynebacteriales bacterium]|uniref:Uncharacterized protein n=1 Tax=uncultured Mycobacteriales bacterium TaxID=581187 RepID=A0A6J4HTU8_9ACTN|nr:MAG: hypothetical protein AVDCRST_MAG41-1081 [uncultured Corynebacteriales bacterium]
MGRGPAEPPARAQLGPAARLRARAGTAGGCVVRRRSADRRVRWLA